MKRQTVTLSPICASCARLSQHPLVSGRAGCACVCVHASEWIYLWMCRCVCRAGWLRVLL